MGALGGFGTEILKAFGFSALGLTKTLPELALFPPEQIGLPGYPKPAAWPQNANLAIEPVPGPYKVARRIEICDQSPEPPPPLKCAVRGALQTLLLVSRHLPSLCSKTTIPHSVRS